MKLKRTISQALGLFGALVLAGCQTASLEDAAPTVVPPIQPTVVAEGSDGNGAAVSPADAQALVVRRNPGFMSVVPIERTAPAENQEFVASGARRAGQFPTFGRLPTAANTQLTEAERVAAEAEMTELLKARASTPDARAQYDARLQQLRALAANHAREAQEEIEN